MLFAFKAIYSDRNTDYTELFVVTVNNQGTCCNFNGGFLNMQNGY